MKHLFLVHSPITFLTSVSVIKELNLSNDNAIIIFFEFEKIISKNNAYSAVSINDFYPKKISLKKIYNYFKYFNVIKRIDRLVDFVTNNEKFTVYIPALLFAGKALITNANCVGFNFIEEGMANYTKEDTLNTLAATKLGSPWRSGIVKNTRLVAGEVMEILRGYNFKLQSLPFSYSCYHAFKNVFFYGLSNDSFPLVSDNKKVVLPFKQESFAEIEAQNIHLSNQFVWIGDGAVTQYNLNHEIYLKGIREGCIGFLHQQNVKNIFIKFHRDEPQQLREAVKQLFAENNINFEIIPDNKILELPLFESVNATLIGVFSSLLYYAAITNHTAYSIYNFLKPEYSKIFANRDFSFFWNKVKLIAG